MPPRRFVLNEANYRQLREYRPNIAILPWGATEAHNLHLPHGTDTCEAASLAEAAAQRADARGARVIVLPAIPFGNNEAQLDQVATISITTTTAAALLDDIARSLMAQGIDRLLILNAHGGNDHKPLIRDVQARRRMLMVLVNFWQLLPEQARAIFDDPGDHAGELETSFLLHTHGDLVELDQAGPGARNPFDLPGLNQPGVWTPRPWSRIHPDTGSGNPRAATADKGRRYFEALAEAVADVLITLSAARKGQLPYI